jgi:hypothetical protein
MTDKQRLAKLLTAESYLKRTTAGYSPTGPWWLKGMPLLWEVRMSLGSSSDGSALAEAHGLLKQTEKGYDPRAPRWKDAMAKIDRVEANLAKPPVPNLGPVIYGSKPILLESPTHNTDGLFQRTGSEYPAFDFGWIAGMEVLAPENLTVTDQSSAMGADAFYATGVSGLKYWFGHIVKAPATGVRFEKGNMLSRIALIPGADHGHLGIDARTLIGKDLKWGRNGNGPDYTFGAPTIGVQLTRA